MSQAADPLADDIRAALDAVQPARQRFDALPPSHRREYLRWVDEARKAETRARRIAGMIDRLQAG